MPYGRAEAFSVSINAKVFCMRGFKFIDGEKELTAVAKNSQQHQEQVDEVQIQG